MQYADTLLIVIGIFSAMSICSVDPQVSPQLKSNIVSKYIPELLKYRIVNIRVSITSS